MATWQAKLDRFLEPWRQLPELTGALACGSFITGQPNPKSDLDVHLVLAESACWRERGNRIIDGLMIEYFANPPRQIRTYFREDHESRRPMAATQFATGVVLLDCTGDVALLRQEAQTWLIKPFPPQPDWQTELSKYSLWDLADNLTDAFERSAPDFVHLYHLSLQRLFETYARYLGHPLPGPEKLYGMLTSQATRQKYLQPPFPDEPFATAFALALTQTDPHKMLNTFQALSQSILHRMGGFQINGWSLRTPVV
jgi:hypothetical protein